MRTVHVVTHPEATHHVGRMVGGRYHSRLTAAGERAVAAVADALRSRIPGGASVKVFSSDLRRTARTSSVIGAALAPRPAVLFAAYRRSGGLPR